MDPIARHSRSHGKRCLAVAQEIGGMAGLSPLGTILMFWGTRR